jgi:hypothetical protein
VQLQTEVAVLIKLLKAPDAAQNTTSAADEALASDPHGLRIAGTTVVIGQQIIDAVRSTIR